MTAENQGRFLPRTNNLGNKTGSVLSAGYDITLSNTAVQKTLDFFSEPLFIARWICRIGFDKHL